MRRRHRRSTRPTVSNVSAPAGCVPLLANRPMDPRTTVVVVAAAEDGGAE
jgi:hypothetical protein